jgi:flagellar motor switch protein FliM
VRPQRTLNAAGMAASHCNALVKQRAPEADLLPELRRFGERLARSLPPVLAALAGGKAPEVQLSATDQMSGAELAEAVGPLAANCLLSIARPEHKLLLSIDGSAVLVQLDRAFGGTGELKGKLPNALPLSADLLAKRVERGIVALLEKLAGTTEPLQVLERDSVYATLAPFRSSEALAVLAFEVSEAGTKPWTVRIATRADSLAMLVPSTGAIKRPAARRSGPLDGPFSEITLELEAILSEMRIPLSRLAALAPGQTLPIAVARAIPLRVGGTVVARGTVGEFEDRVALQIIETTPSRKDAQ